MPTAHLTPVAVFIAIGGYTTMGESTGGGPGKGWGHSSWGAGGLARVPRGQGGRQGGRAGCRSTADLASVAVCFAVGCFIPVGSQPRGFLSRGERDRKVRREGLQMVVGGGCRRGVLGLRRQWGWGCPWWRGLGPQSPSLNRGPTSVGVGGLGPEAVPGGPVERGRCGQRGVRSRWGYLRRGFRQCRAGGSPGPALGAHETPGRRWGFAAVTAVEGGVGAGAPGAWQPVAEGVAVLAGPCILPCEAVSLSQTPAMNG